MKREEGIIRRNTKKEIQYLKRLKTPEERTKKSVYLPLPGNLKLKLSYPFNIAQSKS